MALIQDTPTWNDVYLLDQEDSVDAGSTGDGPANTQAKQLANRCAWLKQQLTELQNELATVATSGKYADLSGSPPLGTASKKAVGYFATAAQGTKADNAIPKTKKGKANGVCELDANKKVPAQRLPASVHAAVYSAATQTEQVQLPANSGDYCIRTDQGDQAYIRLNSTNGDMTDWQAIKMQLPIGSDAPLDSKQYLRKDGAWAALSVDTSTPQTAITTHTQLTAAHSGHLLVCTNTTPIVLTFPASLAATFECLVLKAGTGRVRIDGNPQALLLQDGKNTLAAKGHSASIMQLTNNTYAAWLAGSLDEYREDLMLESSTPLDLETGGTLELENPTYTA